MPRLGVNIDHVATLRQARGGAHPDPVHAAVVAERAGADGITLHLREDRRHVQERDLRLIAQVVSVPVNLELAADQEVIALALEVRPAHCCLVPERRQELTTEGGLDVAGLSSRLADAVTRLREAGIQVQAFVDPAPAQVEAAAKIGAHGVEIHTGRYADAPDPDSAARELRLVADAIAHARALGLHGHAGHGLDYRNVLSVARLPGVEELNIGHSIIARAVFDGLDASVRAMNTLVSGGSRDE